MWGRLECCIWYVFGTSVLRHVWDSAFLNVSEERGKPLFGADSRAMALMGYPLPSRCGRRLELIE